MMPDYEFIEWNESNFNIHICPYVEQAYEARKFAFVSDYARGHALYEMGGIYLDTDVEVLKSFDDLLNNRSLWGFEAGNYIATSTIGSEAKHEYIKAYLEQYKDRNFLNSDNSLDLTTNVRVVTNYLKNKGLSLNGTKQVIEVDNIVLPERFFSPYDPRVGRMTRSKDSYTIHHYGKSWHGPWAKVKGALKKALSKIRK